MLGFLLVVISIPATGILWWWWADRRLRGGASSGLGQTCARHRVAWRWALGCVVIGNSLAFGWLLVHRLANVGPEVPLLATISTFVWHMAVLPVLLILTLGLLTIELIAAGITRTRPTRSRTIQDAAVTAEVPADRADGHLAHPPTVVPTPSGLLSSGLTRREALAGAIAAAPIVLQGGAIARSYAQLDHFRIRRIDVGLTDLPAGLDGFTIAHVTDTHVGRFTHGSVLASIVERVNALQADLVVHTGDLINDSLEDLPAAADMLLAMQARHGVYVVEGNHDLFESRAGFARGLRTRGVALLTNETATLAHGGARLQLLGLHWGPVDIEDIRRARGRGAMIDEHMATTVASSDPGAFRVALAHHPHAFDAARSHGVPLTLAGHTHGGQLNLFEDLGPGHAMYKYVSGLYSLPMDGRDGAQSPDRRAACVVGNGTGNWFPLRLNAPAEVILVTLRRATA